MKKKSKGYWTVEKVAKIALKCKTRNEFQKKYASAYMSAYVGNYMDMVCAHMPYRKKHTWLIFDKEKVEFLKGRVGSLKELRTKFPGAYYQAYRHGLTGLFRKGKARGKSHGLMKIVIDGLAGGI